jgi:hypothetical protein
MRLPRNAICLLATSLSLGIIGCGSDAPKIAVTFNQGASLKGDLPSNPLQWKVITSALSPADSTMSTLYGNDVAVSHARTNSEHSYPNGSILSMVTWTQRDDPRYFGAKIPDQVRSVEFVSIQIAADGKTAFAYQKFEGTPLKSVPGLPDATQTERAAYLLGQRAAVMP